MTDLATTPNYLPKYAREERPYEGDPWAKQSTEPNKAFAAFECYLSLEPEERTLTKANDLYRQRNGMVSQQGVGSAGRWSKIHRWEERAEAYDAYVAARQRARLERRKLKAAERHADQLEDALEVFSAPSSKLAARLREQAARDGVDFIDNLDDEDLMKLARVFAGDLPGLQKAQREALGSGGGVSAEPAKIRAKGEKLRRLIANPQMLQLIERVTLEVEEPIADEG